MIDSMPWWVAVLATLGLIVLGPVVLVIGDIIDRRFQAWQDVRLQNGVAAARAERLKREVQK